MYLKFLSLDRKKVIKQVSDDRGEFVLREGTRQIRKLITKGLIMPVVML